MRLLTKRLPPLLFLTIVLLAGCGRPSGTPPPPAPAAATPSPSGSATALPGSTDAGLALTLTLPKSSYRRGEPIEALLVIRNTGTDALLIRKRLLVNFLSAPPELRDLAFVISRPTDETRETLRFIPHVRPPRAEDFALLEAGATYEATVEVSAFYPFLEEGAYTIQALYTNAVAPRDGREAWEGELLSNVAPFTIVP